MRLGLLEIEVRVAEVNLDVVGVTKTVVVWSKASWLKMDLDVLGVMKTVVVWSEASWSKMMLHPFWI